MNIKELSLNHLQYLQFAVEVLGQAGQRFVDAGFDPIFDLSGLGKTGVVINVNEQVFSKTEYPTEVEPAQPSTGPTTPAGERAGGGARDTAAPSGEVTAFDTHLRAHNSMLSVPVGRHPSLAEAAPDAVGAECAGTAPVPTKDPAAGDAVASGGELITGPLSEDEKRYILDLHAKNTTRPAIAAFLNRKVQTVALFLTHHEKSAAAQIMPDAADDPTSKVKPLDVKADPQPITEQTGGSSSPAACDGSGRVAGQGLAAPAPNTSLAYDLKTYLTNLPRKGKWTLEVDAELVRMVCNGAQFHHIELDLGVEKAKERFNLLTDSRSFERQKVAAALAAMVAAASNASAKA